MTQPSLPFSSKLIIRLLLVLLVVLALGLGYYHNRWETTQKKLNRLQLKYQQLEASVSGKAAQ